MLSLRKTIVVAAPPARVFDALSSPARLPEFFPVTSVESDGRVGGTFRIHGPDFTDHGIITELQPPVCFAYRYWSTNHGTENTPDNQMTIRYLLQEVAGGTEVLVTHENLLSPERRDLMSNVWDYLLAALKNYVEPAK